MKTLRIAICIVAVLAGPRCACGASAKGSAHPIGPLSKARLGQIAKMLHCTSGGKSTLLLGTAVSGSPRAQKIDPARAPYITVYAASTPFRTKLEGIGDGWILGAILPRVNVVFPVKGTIPASYEEARPGVYLLFNQKDKGKATKADKSKVLLVSLTLDAEGRRQFHRNLETPETRPFFVNYDGPAPGVNHAVRFPDKQHITRDNPARRATIELIWLLRNEGKNLDGLNVDAFACQFALDVDETVRPAPK